MMARHSLAAVLLCAGVSQVLAADAAVPANIASYVAEISWTAQKCGAVNPELAPRFDKALEALKSANEASVPRKAWSAKSVAPDLVKFWEGRFPSPSKDYCQTLADKFESPLYGATVKNYIDISYRYAKKQSGG